LFSTFLRYKKKSSVRTLSKSHIRKFLGIALAASFTISDDWNDFDDMKSGNDDLSE